MGFNVNIPDVNREGMSYNRRFKEITDCLYAMKKQLDFQLANVGEDNLNKDLALSLQKAKQAAEDAVNAANTAKSSMGNVQSMAQAAKRTAEEAAEAVAGKQEVIEDLEEIRSGAEKGASAYQMPGGGIPKEDMDEGVRESLGRADSALQENPVFVAEYGVTTFAEIAAASAAGKSVHAYDANRMYTLCRCSSSTAYFFSYYPYNDTMYEVWANGSSWYADSYVVAKKDDLNGLMLEPSAEGTAGQFLQTDGAGGRAWATPQGGGGTSDYAELTNKPKIENVTLTGNRTLAQLLGSVLKRQSYKPASSQTLAANGTYTVTFTPGDGYEPVCWWYEGSSPNTNLVVSCIHKFVEGTTDEWQIRIYNHGSSSTTIQGTTYCVFIKKVEPQVMLMMGAGGGGAQPHGEIE